MNERIIELAKKLKALAEQGIDGEKQNAITMLQAMMKKHGITMEMINENDAKDHEFITSNDKQVQRFFMQIIANVLGKNKKAGKYVRHPRGKERWFAYCTPSEAIEIQARFDFFWPIWEKEVDIFYAAFIQTNRLYRKPSNDDEKEEKELSQQEKERLFKMMNLMANMDRHVFTKQIGYKK